MPVHMGPSSASARKLGSSHELGNELDFVCRPIYNRNEKNGVSISIRGLWCKKAPCPKKA